MSDIYLQITETPTVVTLSAPVVSGALASTVTVANTVTVALDSNSLSALENVTVTVGAAITGTVTVSNFPATQPVSIASVTIGNTVTIAGTVTANPTGTQTIAGTVTADAGSGFPGVIYSGILQYIDAEGAIAVGINSALPAGTNRIGVVTIGNSVTIGSLPALVAGTAQIGSVTASISGTVPVSISSVTVGNSVTIGSLPAISGTVTANAGTGTFVISDKGTTGEGTVTSFTSTSSAVLKASNSDRKLLTIFNEGSGTIFILLGSGTASTTNYSLRLLSGDYYELEKYTGEVNAIFGSAGTAKITEIT